MVLVLQEKPPPMEVPIRDTRVTGFISLDVTSAVKFEACRLQNCIEILEQILASERQLQCKVRSSRNLMGFQRPAQLSHPGNIYITLCFYFLQNLQYLPICLFRYLAG